MGVTGGGPVAPVPEQLADKRQVLAGHDRVTGCGAAQIMKTQFAELGIIADRPPASGKAVRMPAFGVFRKQEGAGRLGGKVTPDGGVRDAGRC